MGATLGQQEEMQHHVVGDGPRATGQCGLSVFLLWGFVPWLGLPGLKEIWSMFDDEAKKSATG